MALNIKTVFFSISIEGEKRLYSLCIAFEMKKMHQHFVELIRTFQS